MPEESKHEALKQLDRLEKMHPESSEYSVLRSYMDLDSGSSMDKRTNDIHGS
jgi:ATP-dependent Lon protease